MVKQRHQKFRTRGVFALSVAGFATSMGIQSLQAREYLHLPERNPRFLITKALLPKPNPNRVRRMGANMRANMSAPKQPAAVPAGVETKPDQGLKQAGKPAVQRSVVPQNAQSQNAQPDAKPAVVVKDVVVKDAGPSTAVETAQGGEKLQRAKQGEQAGKPIAAQAAALTETVAVPKNAAPKNDVPKAEAAKAEDAVVEVTSKAPTKAQEQQPPQKSEVAAKSHLSVDAKVQVPREGAGEVPQNNGAVEQQPMTTSQQIAVRPPETKPDPKEAQAKAAEKDLAPVAAANPAARPVTQSMQPPAMQTVNMQTVKTGLVPKSSEKVAEKKAVVSSEAISEPKSEMANANVRKEKIAEEVKKQAAGVGLLRQGPSADGAAVQVAAQPAASSGKRAGGVAEVRQPAPVITQPAPLATQSAKKVAKETAVGPAPKLAKVSPKAPPKETRAEKASENGRPSPAETAVPLSRSASADQPSQATGKIEARLPIEVFDHPAQEFPRIRRYYDWMFEKLGMRPREIIKRPQRQVRRPDGQQQRNENGNLAAQRVELPQARPHQEQKRSQQEPPASARDAKTSPSNVIALPDRLQGNPKATASRLALASKPQRVAQDKPQKQKAVKNAVASSRPAKKNLVKETVVMAEAEPSPAEELATKSAKTEKTETVKTLASAPAASAPQPKETEASKTAVSKKATLSGPKSEPVRSAKIKLETTPQKPGEIAAQTKLDKAAVEASEPQAAPVQQAKQADKQEAEPSPPKLEPFGHKEYKFAAIDKLLALPLNEDDKKNLQEAIYATQLRKFDRTTYAIRKIKNKAARALAQWYYLRRLGLGGDYKELEAFRRAHPDWPSQMRLRKRVERMIAGLDEDPHVVKAFFKESPPVTGAGIVALAMAELKLGNKAKASKLIRKAWMSEQLDTALEEVILQKFDGILTKQDHVKRMHFFLYKNRTGYYIDGALRMAELAGKSRYMPILKARSAVIHMDNTKGAKRKIWEGRYKERYAKLSAKDRRDWGVRFNRIQYLRRKEKFNEAWKLLLAAPTDTATIISPLAWWKERLLNARYALYQGRPALAYRFVANHGELQGKYLEEAQFMSGWIALRMLAEPDKALQHFQKLRKAVTSRRGKAKAHYWLGRVFEAKKDPIRARLHYQMAARFQHTYYGQLAAYHVDPNHRHANFRELPIPTKEETERFINRSAVQGLIYAYKAEKRGLLPLFFNHLAWTLKSPGELVLLNALAKRIGSKRMSVRVGKIAVFRGFPLDHYAYPIDVLPDFKRLVPVHMEVEPALMYALIRQESEFNFRAKSWVGARGLMQFMPRTARAVARQFKQHGHTTEMLFNPKYNLMLGHAHLSDLIREYRGSYILTLCAYNAGGPRVSQWIKAFGDPRSATIDPIDWVERIPFKETRQYVKKILASTQIYRARFENPATAMRLRDDLYRGDLPEAVESAPLSDAATLDKKEG